MKEKVEFGGGKQESERRFGMLRALEGDAHLAVAIGRDGEIHRSSLFEDVWMLSERLPEPKDGSFLLLLAADRYHFAVALLAGWKKGHTLLLPPNGQPQVIRDFETDEGFQLTLHDGQCAGGINLAELLSVGGGANAANPSVAAPLRAPEKVLDLPAERVLLWVCTSGSTGRPKRIPKTAAQLFEEAETLFRFLELGPKDQVVATVPCHHIYGLLFGVLLPLVAGVPFVRETPLHAGEIYSALQLGGGSTFLISVPAHLNSLIESGDASSTLRTIVSSGAPLVSELAWGLVGEGEGLARQVIEILGSTETGGVAWRRFQARKSEGNRAGTENPLWKPLPGVEVGVDTDERMHVRSPFVEGASVFVSEDRIELCGDGRFLHKGRADSVVKVAGKRVDREEIQNHLLRIEGVQDAVVLSRESEGLRGCELAALVVAPGHSSDGLRSRLRSWLDPVALPRRFAFVSSIPRNERGKVSREQAWEAIDRGRKGGADQLRTLDNWEALHTEAGGEVFENAFEVPIELNAFLGHFADFAVVPGALQLEFARSHAERCWPSLNSLKRVVGLKFKSPLRPGEKGRVRLTQGAKVNQVRFEMTGAKGQVASQGLLEFLCPSIEN